MRSVVFWLSLLAWSQGSEVVAQKITWDAPRSVAASSFENQHPRIVLSGTGNPVVLWGNSAANAAYLSRWTGSGLPHRSN